MRSARYRRGQRRRRRGQPPTFWDYNERGLMFYRLGDYDQAIAELRRAVGAAVFALPTLHINLGAAYLRKGLYGEARRSLEEALGCDGDSQAAYVLLGHAQLAAGETAAARAAFERACALGPDSLEGRAADEQVHRLYGVLLM
jgi:tetratricopeptide (TPR) repeat protein